MTVAAPEPSVGPRALHGEDQLRVRGAAEEVEILEESEKALALCLCCGSVFLF